MGGQTGTRIPLFLRWRCGRKTPARTQNGASGSMTSPPGRRSLGRRKRAAVAFGVATLLFLGAVALVSHRRSEAHRACPEDGRVRTHTEIFSEGLRAGVREGIFGSAIGSPEQLLARDPDCCLLNSRGRASEDPATWHELYRSEIFVFVDITDETVPKALRDINHPAYQYSIEPLWWHVIFISRCGEFRGAADGRSSSGYRDRIRERQVREFGEIHYAE